MKRPSNPSVLSFKLLAALVFTAAAGAAGSYASAQPLTTADAQQRYKADIERCRSGLNTQDERTCLREAGAALEEARRNRLVTGAPSFEDNQRARCDRLSGTERDDCLQLMTDPGVVVHGSIEGGGIIRERTITVPADPMYSPGAGGLAPAGSTMPAPADGLYPPATAPSADVKPGALTPDTGTYAPHPAGSGLTPGSAR